MLKKVLLVLLILLVLVAIAAGAIFLGGGTLRSTTLAHEPGLQALLALVPEGEDEVFAIPDVSPLFRALQSSEITKEGIASHPQSIELTLVAQALGSAEAVFWTDSGQVRMIANPASWRAALLLFGARLVGVDVPLRREQDLLIVGDVQLVQGQPSALPPAAGNLTGHFFAIHRGGSNRFPPLERPALSAISVSQRELIVRSAATAKAGEVPAAGSFPFSPPAGALASGVLSSSADIVRDLDRFLPFDLGRLARHGAMLVIYDISTGGLLPKPKGLLALPATPEANDAVSSLFNIVAIGAADSGIESRSIDKVEIDRLKRLGGTIEAARYGGQILLGFDEASVETYLKAEKVDRKPVPGVIWTFDSDAERLRPLVDELAEDKALGLAAKRVSRAARQLRSVLRYLEGAKSISAVKRREGSLELMEMTVSASK
jgi:hypothetical protein